MAPSASKRTYRIVIGALAALAVLVMIVVGIVVVSNRPPSPEHIAATLTAMPTSTPTLTPTPTAIPTLAGISPDLLVCQREAGRAMNARDMVGGAHISGDHLFTMTWFSTEWQVRDLQDALPGVILGFDAALEIWQGGCAVYDRVRIEVYDGPGHDPVRRLAVQAPIDELLKWQAGEYNDRELVGRLNVIQY
jgi:hypothetical protein